MGIFTASNVYTESTEIKNVFAGMTINESAHEPNLRGAMAIIGETEENYYNMMKAVGIMELRAFEETGRAIVYEGSKSDGFFDMVKKFFISIGVKIKELFKAFLARMDQAVKKDKAFLAKYERVIKGGNLDVLKDFKGFNFDISPNTIKNIGDNVDTFLTKHNINSSSLSVPWDERSQQNMKSIIEKWDNTDGADAIRGAALKKDKLTDSEFKKELYKDFRGGTDTAGKITINKNDVVSHISSYATVKAAIDKVNGEVSRQVSKVVRDMETAKKNNASSRKDSDSKKAYTSLYMSYINKAISASKTKFNLIQIASGSLMSAANARRNQAKAIAVRLVNNQGTGTVQRESASLLNNVVFK